MGVGNSYVWGLVFLRLGVRNSFVWGLDFLRLGVSNSYVWGLELLCLGVRNFYVLGSVILTFGVVLRHGNIARYSMAIKPIKSPEFNYQKIQFLIIKDTLSSIALAHL